MLRLNWRPDRERFLERDNLCWDVRRRILGLEGGVGSESGLHGRVGADERSENAGGFGSGVDQRDCGCFHAFDIGRFSAHGT